jgi:hypothetical protein
MVMIVGLESRALLGLLALRFALDDANLRLAFYFSCHTNSTILKHYCFTRYSTLRASIIVLFNLRNGIID